MNLGFFYAPVSTGTPSQPTSSVSAAIWQIRQSQRLRVSAKIAVVAMARTTWRSAASRASGLASAAAGKGVQGPFGSHKEQAQPTAPIRRCGQIDAQAAGQRMVSERRRREPGRRGGAIEPPMPLVQCGIQRCAQRRHDRFMAAAGRQCLPRQCPPVDQPARHQHCQDDGDDGRATHQGWDPVQPAHPQIGGRQRARLPRNERREDAKQRHRQPSRNLRRGLRPGGTSAQAAPRRDQPRQIDGDDGERCAARAARRQAVRDQTGLRACSRGSCLSTRQGCC